MHVRWDLFVLIRHPAALQHTSLSTMVGCQRQSCSIDYTIAKCCVIAFQTFVLHTYVPALIGQVLTRHRETETSIQMLAIRSVHTHGHVIESMMESNRLSSFRMLGRSNIVTDSCRLLPPTLVLHVNIYQH